MIGIVFDNDKKQISTWFLSGIDNENRANVLCTLSKDIVNGMIMIDEVDYEYDSNMTFSLEGCSRDASSYKQFISFIEQYAPRFSIYYKKFTLCTRLHANSGQCITIEQLHDDIKKNLDQCDIY